MRTRQSFLPAAALALLVAAAGCAGSSVLTGEKLEQHLAQRLMAFEAAYNESSIENVMAFFAPEPEVAPGGQVVSGEVGVRNLMQQSIATTSDLDLVVAATTEGEGTFEQRGRYLVDDGSAQGTSGGFVARWIRAESGEWLIARLSWTQE